MKLTRWLCVMVLMLGAGACSGTSSKGASGSGGTTTSAGATGTPSASSPSGSESATASAPGGSSASASSPQPPITAQRVAELSTEGGFANLGALKLPPPSVAIYSDGTVILGAAKRFQLDSGALNTLLDALEKDLAGQPGTLTPTVGHPRPDSPDTVLGVRMSAIYQTVRANSLPVIGPMGGYPAPVFDAYNKLEGLLNTPAANGAGPYTPDMVRYVLLCPTSNSTTAKSWPVGLPDPTNGGNGPDCPETHVVTGKTADVVKNVCKYYAPAEGEAKPPVPYMSKNGIRTCEWRYALPDEVSA